MSRRVLNISREGDSTNSLGSLGQGSVTLRGKKFFLSFSWNFLCFSLCPLPLVLSLDHPHQPGNLLLLLGTDRSVAEAAVSAPALQNQALERSVVTTPEVVVQRHPCQLFCMGKKIVCLKTPTPKMSCSLCMASLSSSMNWPSSVTSSSA